MKNNKIFILCLAISVTFGSCKKFLDEEPYSFISSEALYKTDLGCETAINGCYGTLAEYGGFGAGYLTIMTVGSGAYYTAQAPAADLSNLTFGGSTLWLTNNSPWDAFYNAIKVANDIIENVPKGNASDYTKKKTVAEARFIRGMLYFNLVRMFGGVPLRTKPVTEQDVNIARSTKDEVYNFLIADLIAAKDGMIANSIKGRPSKFAAQALLGKVYMTLASDPSIANSSVNWQKAKDELLAVVNSNAYSLFPSYSGLFDAANENTSESIIEIQYTISGGPQGQFTNFFCPTNSTFTPLAANGPFGRNRLNKEIVDTHRLVYPLDPRRKVNYIDSQYNKNDGTVQRVWPLQKTGANSFVYIKKYIDPNYVATNSNRNFIYLRYADVLLMLAEVENELNGPANAYQYINQVLSRARNTVVPASSQPANWAGMTQAEFRGRIMLERQFELIGECHLWYDVRRRGPIPFQVFLDRHNTYPANLTSGVDFKYQLPQALRTILLPIPDKEINSNTLINPSDQNPGY